MKKKTGKKTPFEIKKAIIDAIKGDLEGGNNFDFKSDSLYVDVVTEVEQQIKKTDICKPYRRIQQHNNAVHASAVINIKVLF